MNSTRKIGVVTTSRADYGVYVPLLRRIASDPSLQLLLYVSGMHLCEEFGMTVHDIEKDGFPIATKINTLVDSDTPEGTAKSIGLTVSRFAEFYGANRPDILVILGDRFEMYGAALAALPLGIPIAHIAGGSVTEGSFDDTLRHSLTKMAHLHFVETATYQQRIWRMGEEPWRTILTGALSLDNLKETRRLSLKEINQKFETNVQQPYCLVALHPVTRELHETEILVANLLEALEHSGGHLVISSSNADPAGRSISKHLEEYACKQGERATYFKSFGAEAFFSLMAHASVMVGNSSSSIIEAPSFKLPVVNIGIRQKGRVHAANLISVGTSAEAILAGIRKALAPNFRESLKNLVNPYGNGGAADRIVQTLRTVPIDQKLLLKSFFDG